MQLNTFTGVNFIGIWMLHKGIINPTVNQKITREF